MIEFVENNGNVALLNGVKYIVIPKNPFSMRFFEDSTVQHGYILVNETPYPLIYAGRKLCSDLKYREHLDEKLGYSGPYSAFKTAGWLPEDDEPPSFFQYAGIIPG
jgi:hypothetical protein